MKLNSIIIISKGLAFVIVGVFSPWIAALAQYANTGQSPPRIVWLGVILPLSMMGAGNAWVAFTSSSWKEFSEQKKADDSGVATVTTVQPTAPPLALVNKGTTVASDVVQPPNP